MSFLIFGSAVVVVMGSKNRCMSITMSAVLGDAIEGAAIVGVVDNSRRCKFSVHLKGKAIPKVMVVVNSRNSKCYARDGSV